MQLRQPIVAGRFYPDDPATCRTQLLECIRRAVKPTNVPTMLCAGIVPHAGWMCSGHVAAAVFRELAASRDFSTVIMFSAVHRWSGRRAAIYDRGGWHTPLGPLDIDHGLADTLLTDCELFASAPEAHLDEHSLEVQMPFVRQFFPEARVLPIMTPPTDVAPVVGAAVGRAILATKRSAVVVGTTDLTHYGPGYGFTPQGRGENALRWAKEVNDRRMIELITCLDADKIVAEAATHHNACGGGAVAATIAAARALGANRAALLQHTTSQEALGHPGDDAVGYAGVVFGT